MKVVGSPKLKLSLAKSVKPSRYSKPVCSAMGEARKAALRRIRRRALRQIGAMLPNLKRKKTVDELTIVREASRYIDQLHATIFARVCSGALSADSVMGLFGLHAGSENFKQRFGHFMPMIANRSTTSDRPVVVSQLVTDSGNSQSLRSLEQPQKLQKKLL